MDYSFGLCKRVCTYLHVHVFADLAVVIGSCAPSVIESIIEIYKYAYAAGTDSGS